MEQQQLKQITWQEGRELFASGVGLELFKQKHISDSVVKTSVSAWELLPPKGVGVPKGTDSYIWEHDWQLWVMVE